MSSTSATAARSRRVHHRLFDVALLVWGVASAAVLVSNGLHDAQAAAGWPRWLELIYVLAVLVAVPALLAVGWAKARLRRLGAVLDDERTAATHTRSMAAALVSVLGVQLPVMFRVDLPAIAQAKFTIAAALLTYGVARLWFNREA